MEKIHQKPGFREQYALNNIMPLRE